MKNRWIRTAVLVITLCAVLLSLPPQTQAAAVMKTGSCGDNLTWTLDDEGVLTVSGSGDMSEYDEGYGRWFPYWESIKSVIIEDGVTTIGEKAFSGCTNLASVTIPQSVTAIGGGAFLNCSSLITAVIPDSVLSLGPNVFEGCAALESVTLPNSITNIREFSFYGCSSLKSIVIPDSVSNIGECAFEDCAGLLSVTMPKAVVRIGLQAFHNCKRLWHVFYKGTEQDWEKININADQNELHWAGRHYTCSGTEQIDPDTSTCSICVSRCEHNWNTGTVTKQPTSAEEGVLTYTCIDCNLTKTESIEKSDTPPAQSNKPAGTTDSTSTVQGCTSNTGKVIPWWWLVAAIGACLSINALVTVILLKKKK